MLKIKKVVFIVLLSCLFSFSIKASDFTTDDSCTSGVGLLTRFVDNLTTFGLFEAFSYNFHMYGAPGTTGTVGYGSGNDSTYGCSADYYPDQGSTTGSLHNSTYCQSNGTNCCSSAIDPSTGMPYPDAIGVPGGCSNDCNPAGGVKFCYDQLNGSSYECVDNWVQAGYTGTFYYPPAQIRAVTSGGYICIQFATNLGYQSIGCKPVPNCTQDVYTQNCAVAPSCYSYSAQKSLFIMPITGAIVQCINDTIQYLFYGNPNCTVDTENNLGFAMAMFPNFQAEMRNAVRSALMLYIILFGIKTVLSSEHPSKSEFCMLAAKFILVLYFSTGININGVVGTDGQPYYDDGIHRYMLPLFTGGASELADMVYSAGSATSGICAYDPSLYENGYGYLSMWDSLDCRLLYYFGIDLANIDMSSASTGGVMTPDDLGTPILLYMLVPAFFSFQLLFLVFTVVFAVLILSVLVFFVNITVISAILVAIMIYLAPVFVPMALFEVTKSYYDSWLKLTISYALQPMIIAAYIAMMFTVYDQTMFGTCLFQKYTVNFQMDGVTKGGLPFFTICDPGDANNNTSTNPNATGSCYDCQNMCTDGQTENCYTTTASSDPCAANTTLTPCENTIGYFINPVNATSYTNSISAIFFTIVELNTNVAENTTASLMVLCLFCYLFYKFGEVIGDFAAELTGGDSIGEAAGSPMAMAKAAADMAKKVAKAAMESGKGGSDNSKKPPESKANSSSSKPRSNAKSSSSDSK